MERSGKKDLGPLRLVLRELKGLFIFFLVLAGVYVLFHFSPLYETYSVESLRELLGGLGGWAVPVFLVSYIILPLFLFPIYPLSMVSGAVFGTVSGFLLSATGYMLSAWLAFFLARGMFREKIVGVVSGRGIRIDRGLSRNGVLVTFLLRFVPVTPVGLQSYAVGLSGIGFARYTLGTALGGLVWVFVFVLMGDSLVKPDSLEFFTSVALWSTLFLVSILVLIKNRTVFTG
jgi:uncharacterized membrane protein YdjX (TVP38/TMEM64 family)